MQKNMYTKYTSGTSAPNQDDIIHVALCLYDQSGTYSQHTGAAITSLFKNTTSKVTVHILHDDTLTDANRAKFIRTAEKYSQSLELHDVTEYRYKIGRDLEEFFKSSFSIGTLYKLSIHEVLPVKKVIYLDSDIIVNLDIKELWDIELGNNYLAGALDEVVIKEGRSPFSFFAVVNRLNGSRAATHINAGVLVMNLEKLRERENFFSEAIRYTVDHLYTYTSGDQKTFNALCFGHIKIIDIKFNNELWDSSTDLTDTIIHTNKRKSWLYFPQMYADCLYWKMFLHSAWGENVTREDFVDILSRIKDPALTPPTLSQTLYQFIKEILRKIKLKDLLKIANLPFRYVYYRIKYRNMRR